MGLEDLSCLLVNPAFGCAVQEADDLFETLSQCLLSACNRDALSGWGGVVHIITPKGVTSKKLKSRQD